MLCSDAPAESSKIVVYIMFEEAVMKKYLSSVFFVLVLALSLSMSVPAVPTTSGTTGQAAQSTTATAGSNDTAQAVTGTTATTADPAPAAKPAYEVRKSGSRTYLFNTSTGKSVRGYKGITEFPSGSGNYYFFLSTKGRVRLGMFKRSGKHYYTKADGTLARGWLTVNKRTYYFNPTDFTRVSGLKKIGKQYYYFTPQTGVQVKGFIRLTNTAKGTTSTYYFNPKKKGARAKGLTKISKRYYYFKNNGKMKTGVFKIKGKYYCFDPEKGYRVNGLQTVNGKTYYFTKKLGYSCMTGWKKRKGIKYYFSSSAATYGQAVTGWLTLGGKQYYFNDKGEMQTGWQTINNKKYYFDPTTGAMATGEVTIGGTKYTFGKDGTFTDPIANATGPWSIRVNLSTNIVTCYRGSTAVKAMYCSPGAGGATPTGTTTIQDKLRWHELMGPSWGQYCEHLFPSILFHSVPYQRKYDPSSMSINGYNQLGQAVSHGCIRLACIDAYYIYTNCPVGTTVKIDYFGNTDPLKATHWPSVRPASGSGLGYDPTDPVYS